MARDWALARTGDVDESDVVPIVPLMKTPSQACGSTKPTTSARANVAALEQRLDALAQAARRNSLS